MNCLLDADWQQFFSELGCIHRVRWQVTLCDPMRQVMLRSSVIGFLIPIKR